MRGRCAEDLGTDRTAVDGRREADRRRLGVTDGDPEPENRKRNERCRRWTKCPTAPKKKRVKRRGRVGFCFLKRNEQNERTRSWNIRIAWPHRPTAVPHRCPTPMLLPSDGGRKMEKGCGISSGHTAPHFSQPNPIGTVEGRLSQTFSDGESFRRPQRHGASHPRRALGPWGMH